VAAQLSILSAGEGSAPGMPPPLKWE